MAKRNYVIDAWLRAHPEIKLTNEQYVDLESEILNYGSDKYDEGYTQAAEDC